MLDRKVRLAGYAVRRSPADLIQETAGIRRREDAISSLRETPLAVGLRPEKDGPPLAMQRLQVGHKLSARRLTTGVSVVKFDAPWQFVAGRQRRRQPLIKMERPDRPVRRVREQSLRLEGAKGSCARPANCGNY